MKLLKTAQKIIAAILLFIIIFLLMLVFIPKLFGYEPYNVLTGSMKPAYLAGSLIYIKKVSADTIKEGDVISFKNLSAANITHRVTSIDYENKTFNTKGDANDKEDGSSVSFNRLTGKASAISIPYAGRLLNEFQNRKITAAAIITGLAIIWIALGAMESRYRKKREGGEADFTENKN